MILAAGLGKRMRPLTDHLPKPLLMVGGKPLIQYPIERLREAGVKDILINLAYRGDQIRAFLGNGDALGVNISYSEEPFPLETGGAIAAALDWLGAAPFLLVNGDVWSDYPFQQLLDLPLSPTSDGCLVMVSNPDFNGTGDFNLAAPREGQPGPLRIDGEGERLTYSGISLLRPALVADYPARRQKFPLAEVFKHAMAAERLQGVRYRGQWQDIGTPERLRELDRRLRGHN